MTHILGINAYHGGASACLIRDGRLIAAVEEERFSRVKYQAGFPAEAIRFVLAEAGIGPQDLDHVGISRKPSANLMKKALFAFRKRPSLQLVRDRLSNSMKVGDLKPVFCENLGVEPASVRAQFHNVEHHRAHMASAFFVSPFDGAAILSVDGMGDFVSTMWGTGRGNRIDVDGAINFPHSLGYFYTAVTQWLGFPKYGDEGKTMGLAPLGTPRYVDEMARLVRIQSDGTFDLDLDYFVNHAEGSTMTWSAGEPVLGPIYSEKLVTLLGEPRVPRSEITEYHQDVAASMQAMLEQAEFALVRKLQRETGKKVLCLAGGVALNSAFNGKILPCTDFEDIWIQPAAGDAGTSLGVCYYIDHQVLGNPRLVQGSTFNVQGGDAGAQHGDAEARRAAEGIREHTASLSPNPEHRTPNTEPRIPNTEHRTPNTEPRIPNTEHRTPYVMTDAYTGPEYHNGRIEDALRSRSIAFETLDEDELVARTAGLVADGNVVGWFQGRMEWGPRALGNRSIIADPRRPNMKAILNSRVKHREPFRPFAPSVLAEHTGEWFDQSYPDPFMLKVYNVRPEKRDLIPAVTHVDGTGRLQTVDRQHSPLYWKLINAFGERTGVPIVLNTSFNENEPIVCKPEEAIDCFQRTKMDVLVVGNHLVTKT